MKQIVAAVGVVRRADGAVFLQCRAPDNVYYPNYWEFPGGKLGEGETAAAAVVRELREEIGIAVESLSPWLVRQHDYAHGRVTLHVFRIHRWQGSPQSCEGQKWQWWHTGEPPPSLLLPASHCLWKWQSLPPRCVVSAAEVLGVEQTLALLPQVAATPLLLQLRDKTLPPHTRQRLAQVMSAAVAAAGGLFVVNDDEQLAREVGAAGVHLSSKQLMLAAARPPFEWVGASCHNAGQLAQACALQLDYAMLSPVAKTLTHVDASPLGWEGFAAHAASSPLPLYALGGMAAADMQTAISHGAHGIAMMRQGWQEGN